MSTPPNPNAFRRLLAVLVLALFCSVWTAPATIGITVVPSDPLDAVSAVAHCSGATLAVTFNKTVDPISGTDVLNYSIFDSEGGVSGVVAAELSADQKTVTLLIEPPLVSGNSYVLIVENVADADQNFIIEDVVPVTFDTTPQVSCGAVLNTLFPPNNQLVDVGLSAAASEGNLQVRVYSDEPEIELLDDARLVEGRLQLRARRNPGSDGRVFLIVVTSTNACGNVGVCCSTVVVPQSGSQASLNSVQSQAAAAQAQCSPTGSPLTPYQILP